MRSMFTIDEVEYRVFAVRERGGYRVHIDDRSCTIGDDSAIAEKGGALVAVDGDTIHVWMDGETVTLRYHDAVRYFGGSGNASASDVILAPMPGTVVAVHVAAGAAVARGDTVMVIESMKLETAIKAPRDGTLAILHVAVGQAFDRSAPLATLAAAEA